MNLLENVNIESKQVFETEATRARKELETSQTNQSTMHQTGVDAEGDCTM